MRIYWSNILISKGNIVTNQINPLEYGCYPILII